MKFINENISQLRISTDGMKVFDILNHQQVALNTGLFDEIKLTKFYRDEGQLFHHNNELTSYAFYIQREDGEFFVGACEGIIHFECIKHYLNPTIKAEVILCKVPRRYVRYYEKSYLNSEYGVLEFIANHHPVHNVRVEIIKLLQERVDA